MLLKKDESGRKSRKVDELAGFELLILTENYIAGYNENFLFETRLPGVSLSDGRMVQSQEGTNLVILPDA